MAAAPSHRQPIDNIYVSNIGVDIMVGLSPIFKRKRPSVRGYVRVSLFLHYRQLAVVCLASAVAGQEDGRRRYKYLLRLVDGLTSAYGKVNSCNQVLRTYIQL